MASYEQRATHWWQPEQTSSSTQATTPSVTTFSFERTDSARAAAADACVALSPIVLG